MPETRSILMLATALVLAPFLRSLINRTKALVGGRHGPPWLQPYYDLAKLFRKGAVYSRTTSWMFRLSPALGLAAALGALALAPQAGGGAACGFDGDLMLFIGLFGLARFCTVLAALDTGSAFCGMGASREAFYAALAEPALLISLGGLALHTRALSLGEMYAKMGGGALDGATAPGVVFLAVALFIVYLTENARIPVDDPTTHLELTMIHEAMILDHGGVDLGLIEYAGALKLWVLGLLIVNLFVAPGPLAPLWAVGALFLLAVAVGVVESAMARFSLLRVPLLLTIALMLAVLWVTWTVMHLAPIG